MIGLFQEHGPCQFYNNQTEPSLNPWSWNNYANMLYVDQPIGTGFSFGDDPVNSTVTAAPYVWNLLQAFYASFPEYECRDFGVFTESYGGHYGPEFAHYIQAQNAAIDDGSAVGEKLALKAVGINNGWFDSTIQERAGIEFAVGNSYRPLINESVATKLYDVFETRCKPALDKCVATGNDTACADADNICINEIDNPIAAITDFDTYDIRQPSKDPFPPDTYVEFLRRPDVMQKIGAKVRFEACPDAPSVGFGRTGDGEPLLFFFPFSSAIFHPSSCGVHQCANTRDRCAVIPRHPVRRCADGGPGAPLGGRRRLHLQLDRQHARGQCRRVPGQGPVQQGLHEAVQGRWRRQGQVQDGWEPELPARLRGGTRGALLPYVYLLFLSFSVNGTKANTTNPEPEASLQVFMQVMQGNAPSST